MQSMRVLFGQICIKFDVNVASKFKINYAGTASFRGTIWDEFSKQH